jgi:hypothetical protein
MPFFVAVKTPSGSQLEALRCIRGPLVLFHESSGADVGALAALARAHGGALRWAATQEQVLIGRGALFGHSACIHFASGAARCARIPTRPTRSP